MYSFRLPLAGFADYAWGSQIVRFGQYTHLTTRTLPEFLAGFLHGRCNWNTPAEFRAQACMVHEMVHYLQDVTTGVGHWDYLVDRDLRAQWNTLSRDASHLGPNRGEIQVRLKELNDEYRRRAVFVPTAFLPAERKRKLHEGVAAASGVALDEVEPDPLFIENLLEGEAVANTYLHLEGLKGSDEEVQIADSNGAAFLPWQLPAEYLETLRLFFGMSSQILAGSPTGKDTYAVLRVSCGFLRAFVDLAMAHPSPDLLERTAAPREEYEPGLRLVRLTRAFYKVPDRDNERLKQAIFECNSDELDKLVTPHCGYPYASYKEIYSDWHRIFEKEAAGRADARIRRDTTAKRISHPENSGYKTPTILLEMGIPLLAFTGQGLVNYLMGADALDSEFRAKLHKDLYTRTRDAGMAAYFLQSEPFVCPLAESNVCESRTDTCRSGIKRNRQFPAAPGCEVRTSLAEAGFWLED